MHPLPSSLLHATAPLADPPFRTTPAGDPAVLARYQPALANVRDAWADYRAARAEAGAARRASAQLDVRAEAAITGADARAEAHALDAEGRAEVMLIRLEPVLVALLTSNDERVWLALAERLGSDWMAPGLQRRISKAHALHLRLLRQAFKAANAAGHCWTPALEALVRMQPARTYSGGRVHMAIRRRIQGMGPALAALRPRAPLGPDAVPDGRPGVGTPITGSPWSLVTLAEAGGAADPATPYERHSEGPSEEHPDPAAETLRTLLAWQQEAVRHQLVESLAPDALTPEAWVALLFRPIPDAQLPEDPRFVGGDRPGTFYQLAGARRDWPESLRLTVASAAADVLADPIGAYARWAGAEAIEAALTEAREARAARQPGRPAADHRVGTEDRVPTFGGAAALAAGDAWARPTALFGVLGRGALGLAQHASLLLEAQGYEAPFLPTGIPERLLDWARAAHQRLAAHEAQSGLRQSLPDWKARNGVARGLASCLATVRQALWRTPTLAVAALEELQQMAGRSRIYPVPVVQGADALALRTDLSPAIIQGIIATTPAKQVDTIVAGVARQAAARTDPGIQRWLESLRSVPAAIARLPFLTPEEQDALVVRLLAQSPGAATTALLEDPACAGLTIPTAEALLPALGAREAATRDRAALLVTRVRGPRGVSPKTTDGPGAPATLDRATTRTRAPGPRSR